MAGTHAIQEAGGHVLFQQPVPGALSDTRIDSEEGLADRVIPIEEVADAIVELVSAHLRI